MEVVALVILAVIAIVVAKGVRVVPQQNARVVERLGKSHAAPVRILHQVKTRAGRRPNRTVRRSAKKHMLAESVPAFVSCVGIFYSFNAAKPPASWCLI